MKNITIIGSAHPFRGGLAAYNERLAKELIRMGHQVKIETFTIQYPGILFPGKTQYADWEAPDDLMIQRTVSSINPLNWFKVGRRIKHEQPDLVIFKYWLPFMAPCFGTIIRQIKKNRHTKVVCIADNIIPHEGRPGDKMLTQYFLKKIDGIIAMSKSVYNDVLLFDSKMPRRICPHPLFDNFGKGMERSAALQRLDLSENYRYLLFFGFIREYKGLDLLIQAMADERLMAMPLKVIVGGEFYTKPEPYLKLIERLELQDRIILKTEFIADHEVNSYFCSADMIVQPYKSATQSGVTQIGYHFDKPMLVTDVGGLSEIIPDGKIGYVVPPEKKAIADAIFDFYKNERFVSFTENVKKEKKKFAWSNMAKAVLEVTSKNLDV